MTNPADALSTQNVIDTLSNPEASGMLRIITLDDIPEYADMPSRVEDNESMIRKAIGAPQKPYSYRGDPKEDPWEGRIRHRTRSGFTLPTTGSRGYEFEGKQVWGLGPTLPSNVSGFFRASHQAFNLHQALTLDPDSIWYAIVHEMAICIKQDPEKYRSYFTEATKDEGKIKIVVDTLGHTYENPDWAAMIKLFYPALQDLVPGETTDLFLPMFTTTTTETRVASLVAFMDVVSEYYEYRGMPLCGVPRIKLMGTVGDWQTLLNRTVEVAKIFAADLQDYFSHLQPVLEKLVGAAEGDTDEEFWKTIYVNESDRFGSGSKSFVSGWLTNLTAFVPGPDGGFRRKEGFIKLGQANPDVRFETDQFPAHISSVDYKWDPAATGNWIDMKFAAGFLGVDIEDGFVTPRLGYAVAEM